MTRTTTLRFEQSDMSAFIDALAAKNPTVGYDTLDPEILRALGYFSRWAMDGASYARCSIYLDKRNCEISAAYYPETASDDTAFPAFVMGAVWDTRSKTFTFHS